ncbi:PKD domain-containing protein [Spongiimicrobium salis]|uniref:PKD domain-containing protein n=1 Tax=Spongiimicrobium salis TaxID=1667022 RepID=UPI00374DC485
MMRKRVLTIRLISKTSLLLGLVFALAMVSCDFLDDLPEANSLADETPPTAFFTFTNGVEIETFTQVQFANQSDNAIDFLWDLGNGTTSTEIDPVVIYPGEGSFTVSLTVSDALGQTATYSETIELIEPEAPAVPDPILLNPEFVRSPKSSGSDCTCSGWINRSLGEQGESSSGNGSDVLKFDNAEPDHVYQEFEVVPNADYRIEIPILFQSDQPGDLPSQLEIRVLAGEGYVDGYTPVYFTDTAEIPQDGFGYASVPQTEIPENVLLVEAVDNPNTSEYRVFAFFFNAGSNDSVALFIRGIGNSGPEDPADFAMYGYASGDEEIRADSVTITAIN